MHQPDSTSSPRIRDLPEADRPREKLAARGPGALTDAELLAIFFGTGRRGQSAVDLGRELIRRFGSLQSITRRTLEELSQIPGIGPAKATQLAAVFEFGRRLAKERYREHPIDCPEAVYDLLGQEMRGLNQETVRLVLLDNRSNLLHVAEVTRGTLNECIAHPRDIFRTAIAWSAASFVLVHNHPSGNPQPSQADISLTRQLRDAALLLKIDLQDHVIIGSPSESLGSQPYYSFRESGLI
ncbi:MAG: DNA repair protein RadC [Verrucomicrobiae bacterium]|nr:DNA repair protein RadC [Verrucomicrobiae bacterium]MCB1088719.1 DNA repair protein RadC [Verrucomicrobiae bacterium]MCB1093464.1 DNA repair protein RadC [Verrucomicrobiae bacterium]